MRPDRFYPHDPSDTLPNGLGIGNPALAALGGASSGPDDWPKQRQHRCGQENQQDRARQHGRPIAAAEDERSTQVGLHQRTQDQSED